MACRGRILVADDDAEFRSTVGDLLSREGYECDCVPNAASAAERLRATTYDLLVSDLEMPGNSQLELILDLPRLARGMPALLITGYPSLESAIKSVELPIAAYLVKPVSAQELLQRVRECVTHSSTYHAVRSIRNRLQDWRQEMEDLEQWLSRARVDPAEPSLSAVLDLTLANTINSLLDLRRAAETAPPPDGSDESAPNGGAGPLEALKEAIDVLRQTKNSFKSKQLARLRRKLERVVEGSG